MTSLSPPLQAVVALFRGPLSGVRFADVDANGLSSLAADVESATAEIEAQEAKLAELRQALAQKHDALLTLAHQALAYARIYAENDEALSAELSQIALPRATKPRKAAKAGPVAEASAPTAEASATAAEATPATGTKEEATAASDSTVDPEADEGKSSKPRLVNKPKKRYSRVPPQSRAS